ncbi:hypothetical protein RUND412_002411 [Rhizina undulata]
MFGTPMVVLPSYFTGGDVHLRHGRHEKCFTFSGPLSASRTSYAAWYTDILHWVEPIESGYRFALSYNLYTAASPSTVPRAPDDERALLQLQVALKDWADAEKSGDSSVDYLCWVLDHLYSKQSIEDHNLGAMKGVDSNRVQRLFELATHFHFDVFLAKIELHHSGHAEGGGADDDDITRYYKRARWDKNHKYMDHYMNLEEEIEKDLSLSDFVSCKTGMSLGNLVISEVDANFHVLPNGYLSDMDEQDPNIKEYGKSKALVCNTVDTLVLLKKEFWDGDESEKLRYGESLIKSNAEKRSNINSSPHYWGELESSAYEDLIAFAIEVKRVDLYAMLKMCKLDSSDNRMII